MNGSTTSDRPAVSPTPLSKATASQPAGRKPVEPDSAASPFPIASHELLQGRREVWIDHQGKLYCLKATSSGRLYLTK